MTTSSQEQRSGSLAVRIAAAWIITLVALSLSGWIGEILETSMGVGPRMRYGLQAVIMAGLVVAGIWWLRTRRDKQTMEGLGLPGLNRSVTCFGFGFGIIAIPTAALLSLMAAVGWGAVNVDLSAAALGGLAVAIATAFLFEALPEELAFRGYIYRNLNTVYRRWAAAALTVVLFVLLPVILVPLQRNILGMDISVGATNHITVDYLIIMTVFGSLVQYLRVLTGNVWTSIGFHLAFLLVNRIMGPLPSRMISVADVPPDAPIQIVALGTVILVLAGLIAWPFTKKSPLGWNQRDPE